MAEVDQLRPWLGLDSFSESTRAFFHGRDEEVGELARRVQRKLLTVLFGQSGLGKTSILRAGIVPRLRGEGYCPVYLRIDYGPQAPFPAQQVRMAIEAAARYDGEAPAAGESLWALLHQRSGSFTDAEGKPVMPLLIFDQFEEIFTLGQGDGGARARAAQFVEELASLVENRPPRDLEERIDSDDALIERYDFAREDYRVLISLREDYLAHLEGLKAAMPSITQNRMRLAPMTGTQALQAVRIPGGDLVTDEVAEAIVRFVAGGAEIGNAQIEPSLLSLICRELNDTRIAGGRGAITLDLLEGSHASILSDFYERAMAGQPPAVRAVIEDALLTDSGYRENVAQERIEQLLANAGARQGALTDLVNRRLLRIEERLDLRRVELTHDVLCSVVRASRDLRQEREARHDNERKLAEQKEREIGTRKSLVRTRQVAIGSAVLAGLAIVAFGFAWNASENATRAEKTAETTRRSAAMARDQAELLIGYLNEDFAQQVSGIARQDIIESLNKRTLDYYLNLPAIAPGSDTERNEAMAMVRYGVALRYTSRLTDSGKYLAQAVKVLEARRAGGDLGQETALALANAYLGQRRLAWADSSFEVAFAKASAAADVAKPWAIRPGAPVAVRRLYAEILNSKGGAAAYFSSPVAIRAFDDADAIYTSIGAGDLSDKSAAAELVMVAAGSLYLRYFAGEPNIDAYADTRVKIARTLIEGDPGNIQVHSALGWLLYGRGRIAFDRHDVNGAIAYEIGSVEQYRAALKLDPVNQNLHITLVSMSAYGLAETYLRAGQADKAIQTWRQALEETGATGEDASLASTKAILLGMIASQQAQTGVATASASVQEGAALLRLFAQEHPAKAKTLLQLSCTFDVIRSKVEMVQGELARATSLANERKALVVLNSPMSTDDQDCVDDVDEQLGAIDLAAGRHAQAVAMLSRFDVPLKLWQKDGEMSPRTRRLILLAQGYVGTDDDVAARRILVPLIAEHRKAVALRGGDRMLDVELAAMLALQARASSEHAGADLAQARALLAALPSQMKKMHDVRRWHDMVEESIRKAGKA